MTALELTLLYLTAAVLGVAACRWLKLPAILGYLTAGVLIEPHTLGLAFGQDADSIKYLAEFGVVFLMFVIGLEFNLPKLRAMRRHVFGLGLAQVVLTMLLVGAGSLLLGRLLPPGGDAGASPAGEQGRDRSSARNHRGDRSGLPAGFHRSLRGADRQ